MSDPQAELSLPGVVRAEIRRAKRTAKSAAPKPIADVDPVARVLVDVPLAHLDRAFDYAVPATMADIAVPGARVKVRFAGQDVDGFIVERAQLSDHAGTLQPVRRVVSPERVLRPEIADLCATIAARYAGTRSDVLRLAVPPRHASVEAKPSAARAPEVRCDETVARDYPGGQELLVGLRSASQTRAVWTIAPAEDWVALFVEAILATSEGGRGSLVCVPDHRDLDRLQAGLSARIGTDSFAVLRADSGPAKRYAAFLAVARGAIKIVIGTRAAAFAPVHDLGLVAIWDDGDDLFAEPRAPYPHAREVLLQRAQDSECAAILAAYARSVEAQYLIETGWAREMVAPRELLRSRLTVTVSGGSDRELARDPAARSARLPGEALVGIREALQRAPVLVFTPRAGYATRLACQQCRAPANCLSCQGPLRITAAGQPPQCQWCATSFPHWSCAECGHRGLRSPIVGERRTAEELGRAFPQVPVRTSSGATVLKEVPATPAIVVATPGAEPVAVGGYAAVVLLDTGLLLMRADLRVAEEAVRRWVNAAALVRPGGKVYVVGDPGDPAIQSLVRWDPGGFARREMTERQEAHLPPASRVATLTLPEVDVEAVITQLELPLGAEVLGPVQVEDELVRLMVRVPRAVGPALSAALVKLQVQRSTHKLAHVRVQVDPPVI